MNREIKFRGKCLVDIGNIKKGDWVYGGISCDTDRVWIDMLYYGQILVDKETVGQYTGLHDKNGKEIYEEDIIRVKNSLIEIEGEVIFDTIDLSFEVYDKENDCKEMLLYVNEEFEVIGNVFEKGILLNDGKKSKKN